MKGDTVLCISVYSQVITRSIKLGEQPGGVGFDKWAGLGDFMSGGE